MRRSALLFIFIFFILRDKVHVSMVQSLILTLKNCNCNDKIIKFDVMRVAPLSIHYYTAPHERLI